MRILILLIPLVTANLMHAESKSATSCRDRSWNCSRLKDLCESQPLIARSCPQTCLKCCMDSSPFCQKWKHNGFCRNNFYVTIKMRRMCKFSCGMCTH
uniref:ShKT domain-containing protein n=1 Tax=Panagrellus redivivus TaxID=6233 RepID=A0A7E4VK48_PANRE